MENMDKYSIQLGKRIAKSRKELGLSQKQLAEKINISQQLVANYELGQRRIHVYLLLQMAEILHVSIDYLVGKNEKERRGPTPKIQMYLEKVQVLPPQKQKMVLEFLNSFIDQEIETATSHAQQS